MMKRILLPIVLCLAILFSACSGSGKQKKPTESTAGTTEENPGEASVPDTGKIVGIWYSEEGNSVFTFDADGVFKIYSLTPGYYEYSNCYTGSYSYDGRSITTFFPEQTDTLPCSLDESGKALSITFNSDRLTFSAVDTLPAEHPVYPYPDFSAIAQTLDVPVPDCTGLIIETPLVTQIRAKIAVECVAEEDLIAGTVEKGDVILFDYRGYKIVDGEQEEFGGGTAEKQTTVAGDGNGYVPGFGAGLIGHGTEEEPFVVEVTFPENYYESLAGQTVYFEMKIHGIYPEITDEMVQAKNESFHTYEEYYTNLLSAALKNNYAVLDLIPQIDFSGVEIPEAAYRYFLQSYLDSLHKSAYEYGIAYETLLEYYKQTEQDLVDRAILEAQTQLKIHLCFRKLQLEISDDLYEKYRDELIQLYLSEYPTVSRELIERYLTENPSEVTDYVTMQLLLDKLICDNTFVSEKEPS